MFDNTKKELIRCIINNGLKEGVEPEKPIYWLSIDILQLAWFLEIRRRDEIMKMQAFIYSTINSNKKYKLVLVPAFAFNFPVDKHFDTKKTKPGLGAFPNFLFKNKEIHRTANPFYSFYAFGSESENFRRLELYNCVGKGSPFEYLHNNKTHLVTIGHHYIKALSSVHQVEYEASVPYRKIIKFSGTLTYAEQTKQITSNFYGREYEKCDFSGITERGQKEIEKNLYFQTKCVEKHGRSIILYKLNLSEAMMQLKSKNPIKNKLIASYKKETYVKDPSTIPIMPEISNKLYIKELNLHKKNLS